MTTHAKTLTPHERLDTAVKNRITCAQELMATLATRGLDPSPCEYCGALGERVFAVVAALNEEERAAKEARLETQLEAAGLGGVLEKLPPALRP